MHHNIKAPASITSQRMNFSSPINYLSKPSDVRTKDFAVKAHIGKSSHTKPVPCPKSGYSRHYNLASVTAFRASVLSAKEARIQEDASCAEFSHSNS